MILALVRRDIALKRSLYIWLLLCVFVGIVLAGAEKTIIVEAGSPSLTSPMTDGALIYTFLISWILLSLYLGPAEVADHGSRWTISLPIPAKALWLSRFLALMIAETALFILTALVIVLVNLVGGSSPLFLALIGRFLIQQYACVLLLIAVIQSLYIKRVDMPSVFSSYVILLLAWLAAGALFYMLVGYPIHYTLYPIAGAGILFAVTLVRLPESFTAAPLTTQKVLSSGACQSFGGRQTLKTPAILSKAKSRWIVWITIFRTLYNPWLIVPAYIVFGVLAMANMDYGLRGKEHLTMLIGMWMFFLILLLYAIYQLYKFDHLPIPRRVIYACQALPSIILLLIMSCVGIVAANYSMDAASYSGSWMRVLPLNLLFILVPWFIMQSFVFAASGAAGLRIRLSILIGVFSLVYLFVVIMRLSGNIPWELPGLTSLTTIDIAQKIPLSTPILWLLTLAILVSGYFITERFFNTASLTAVRKSV